MSYRDGQLVNRAIIPLAIEAGIVAVLRSVASHGMTRVELGNAAHDALRVSNPPLAKAMLDPRIVDTILDYIQQKYTSPLIDAGDIPEMLDVDGPAGTWVSRSGRTVSITWTTPPDGFVSEIYFDGVFIKRSAVTDEGDGNADDTFQVPDGIVPGGEHTIRVLYVREIDGATSRFGPIVTVT